MKCKIGIQVRHAKRRCALKRWLRARGIEYKARDMYSESALRKLVRDAAPTHPA